MDKHTWLSYVNRHINPDSDLPCLDLEKLDRWERLRLLVPSSAGYRATDLERTLALLMLERAITAGLEAGSISSV